MAHIVLVMPSANRFDQITVRIPNGLLAVAALPDAAGMDVRIIDMKVDAKWRQTLAASIGPETLLAGITCSTGSMIPPALECAGAVRALSPALPLVWGGPHPSLLPEQTLAHPLVDYVVINEGDQTIMELVDALQGRRPLESVQGIGYKVDGAPVLTEPRPLLEDLDALPLPPYHLLEVSRYSALSVDGLPSLDIVTSRGCPFSCGFCSTPVTSNRRWRPLSVERVLDNIELLYHNHGIRTFYFVDDNFMVDLRRVERLLNMLNERGLHIFWGTQGVRIDTVNIMTPAFLDLLERSGCKELSIGVESGNPDTLKMIDKRIRVEDVLAANEKIHGRDIAIKYNMIIGFPGESLQDAKNTIDLAIRLYDRNPHAWFPFNIFTPFPSTPMFRKAVEQGFNAPGKLEEWAKLESVGWEKHFNHWLSPEDNEALKSINFTSYLAFPTALQKISNRFIRVLFKLYQPLAMFRFRHMFYRFHVERCIVEFLERVTQGRS